MKTKLTLRLDEKAINDGKRYAEQAGKSLSQVVEEYFRLLQSSDTIAAPQAPITASLRGALRGSTLDEKDYRDHLESKYR